MNNLQWIERLRSFCSSGISPSTDTEQSDTVLLYLQDDLELHQTHISLPEKKCHDQTTIQALIGTELPAEDFLSEAQDPGLLVPVDNDVVESKSGTPQNRDWSHSPRAHLSIDDMTLDSPLSAASPSSPGNLSYFTGSMPLLSAKIDAVLTDVVLHPGKSLVFSFRHATLQKVGNLLENAGIPFLRIDGTMKQADRNSAIQRFRNQASIKALLASISIAAVGLDLTAATQVCLIEPQWNPTTEEQALSRVHRMGQTKPVTTIRYVMRNTIEENILELHKRKIRLATLAFSGETAAVGSSYLEDLKFLLS